MANYSIEVSVREDTSTTIKGRLLETLCAEILKAQQFSVTNTIRMTGIEIDILASHNISSEKILVECKAWESSLPADTITKLLGNLFLKNISCGWLVSTGDLGKDAEGIRIEWESKVSDERKKLSFYTKERIIKLLIDNCIVIDSKNICYALDTKYKMSETHTLLITEYGRFWVVPIIAVTAGIPQSVLLFDAKSGERIKDLELINNVKQTKNSFTELEWSIDETPSQTTTKLIEEEFQNIVTVISGDDWSDYRPSRPEDFVGRKYVIDDIFTFFNNVINKKTDTRIFAIKSPSGWGKSSIILKLAKMAKIKSRGRSFFVYPVDVRTAMSSRYAELTLKSCLESAIKENFIKSLSKDVNIENIVNVFNDYSVKDILQKLRDENKLIVLVFDQFEETFSKKELSSLFESIRKLSIVVDSNKENILLGFAWKTDLSIPAEHSAYFLWSSLADRRKEFELNQFTIHEISSAIKIFEKHLNENINPILKRYLIEQCQGYPWLLKKLCIHVYHLIRNGIEQGNIIGQRLSIKDLFEKDLNELTASELGCITEVAKESPADFFKISEIYKYDVVQSLINRRLLIRRASKLILYWDIFRDYVLLKTIPPIVLNYIPQMQYGTISRVINVLLSVPTITINDLSSKTALNSKTIDNMLIDMVMFGIVERKGEVVTLLLLKEKEIGDCLSDFFKNHIIYKRLTSSQLEAFEYEYYWEIFQKTYEEGNLNPKTQQTYSAKLFSWFLNLELVSENEVGIFKINDFKNQNINFSKNLTQRNHRSARRISYSKSTIFLGQSPPEKVKEALDKINMGLNKRGEFKKFGLRNALELLTSLNIIKSSGDRISIDEEYDFNTVCERALNAPAIKYSLQILDENPSIKGKELGNLLDLEFKRRWSEASRVRNGNAILMWSKYLTNQKLIN